MTLNILLGFVCGLLLWTLLEYIIHYWLGHLPKGKTIISAEHLKHHRNILYFSPLPMKIKGAVPMLILFGAAGTYLVDPYFAAGFVVSIAIGWSANEYVHQSIHVHGPLNRYGRWAAKHHLYHHFVKPNRNHGVTTPLWDYIFRTHDKVDRIAIRERDIQTIPWLAAAFQDLEHAPAFVKDYEIR